MLLKSFIKSQIRLNKSSNLILVMLFIFSSSHIAVKISFKYFSNKSKVNAMISSKELYLFSVDIVWWIYVNNSILLGIILFKYFI